MKGCHKAQKAMLDPPTPFLLDYYDGSSFLRRFGSLIRWWKAPEQIVVFTTMSTDGFEVFEGRTQTRTASPITFMILNLPFCERYRAVNAIVLSFIPGTHDPHCFDSFLRPVVTDLKRLENEIPTICFDGQIRIVKVFVMYFTSDWPAASKVGGFLSHNAITFCRRCHKKCVYLGAATIAFHWLIKIWLCLSYWQRNPNTMHGG